MFNDRDAGLPALELDKIFWQPGIRRCFRRMDENDPLTYLLVGSKNTT